MTYTAEEKLAAVEREVKLRRRVYPNRVQAGKMTNQQAVREIRIMEEIAADYRAQAEVGRLL